MNLLGRLFLVLITSWTSQRKSIFFKSCVRFRTWFHDLDTNFHMNNGRYLTLMDLGRTDLLMRIGLIRFVIRKRWMPVVGSAHISYRRSLALFQSFELRTQIIGWQDKWFFIEQEFWSDERLYARALVKAGLKAKDGMVPAKDIVALFNQDTLSPELPAQWAALIAADSQVLKQGSN